MEIEGGQEEEAPIRKFCVPQFNFTRLCSASSDEQYNVLPDFTKIEIQFEWITEPTLPSRLGGW